jgi:DNA repair ATPase RecN
MNEFLNDWNSEKNRILKEQEERLINEKKTKEKLEFLVHRYELLEQVYDGLSEDQKAKFDRVPRTIEEWKKFNKAEKDLGTYEKDLQRFFAEITELVDKLPRTAVELEEEKNVAAMEVMKKYHWNN